jgi:serine/threonine-protein kinase OSR1/STK39
VRGADDPNPAATDSRVQPSVGSVNMQQFPKGEQCKSTNCNGEKLERSASVPLNKFPSGSLIPDQILSPCTNAGVER